MVFLYNDFNCSLGFNSIFSKTNKYNKENYNKKDYEVFIKSMNFVLLNSEKEIYKNNIDGVDVYIAYIEIPI